jgi:4a-hydroxytetrahydrobiopterin dehydratase
MRASPFGCVATSGNSSCDTLSSREHVAARLKAALAAGGRIVDEQHAPSQWTLADRAGNRVCICAWPDGST